jgi:hypothetical protein
MEPMSPLDFLRQGFRSAASKWQGLSDADKQALKRSVILLALVISATSLTAQQGRSNLWTWDSWSKEIAAGSGADLLARGPWIAQTWRQSFGRRLAISLSLSLVYEYVVEPLNHQTNAARWEDVVQRATGTLLTEGVVRLLTRH